MHLKSMNTSLVKFPGFSRCIWTLCSSVKTKSSTPLPVDKCNWVSKATHLHLQFSENEPFEALNHFWYQGIRAKVFFAGGVAVFGYWKDDGDFQMAGMECCGCSVIQDKIVSFKIKCHRWNILWSVSHIGQPSLAQLFLEPYGVGHLF
jgi:hypothetical protein